jgi:serine/threonine protein kinase
VNDTEDGLCLILEWLPNSITLEMLILYNYNPHSINKNEVANQLVEAVKYLHSKGICHGDLVSENILWDYDQNRLVIIDLESDQFNEECIQGDYMYLNRLLKRLI